MGAIPLSALDLGVAAALVLVAGAVNVALGLGLGRKLAVASTRTVVQLLLVGYVLQWVFGLDRVGWVLLLAAGMVFAAARAAVQRVAWRYDGMTWDAYATLLLTGLLTTFTVTGAIVGVEPWYRAQYVIPLLGMVLGNGLTGISLCLDHWLESVEERRDRMEGDLAMGATRWEAARPHVAEAVRRGMIPILNSMTVVGIVSLPGMMTGQILQGADPLQAVKYQIVVMFMLAAATSLGSVGVALLAYRRTFTSRHQLRLGAVTRRDG